MRSTRGDASDQFSEVHGPTTPEDIAHLRAAFLSLEDEPETCMTSVGYVDVHPTGEVVAHNVIILRFDEDGDVA